MLDIENQKKFDSFVEMIERQSSMEIKYERELDPRYKNDQYNRVVVNEGYSDDLGLASSGYVSYRWVDVNLQSSPFLQPMFEDNRYIGIELRFSDTGLTYANIITLFNAISANDVFAAQVLKLDLSGCKITERLVFPKNLINLAILNMSYMNTITYRHEDDYYGDISGPVEAPCLSALSSLKQLVFNRTIFTQWQHSDLEHIRLQRISIEEFIDEFVVLVEQRRELYQLSADFNQKLMLAFSLEDGLILNDFERDDLIPFFFKMQALKDKQELKSPVLVAIINAIEKAKIDPLFYTKFRHLMAHAMDAWLFHNAPVANKVNMSQLCLYRYFESECKNLHHGNTKLWFPDFSYLRTEKAVRESPLGKKGLADGVFAPTLLCFMSQHDWDFDMGRGRGIDVFKQYVPYFNKVEKKQFKIRKIEDSRPSVVYRNHDVIKHGEHATMPAGEYLYAISYHGGLIAANENEVPNIHHSTLRAGQPVILAGHLTINSHGQIEKMNSCSGHMKPPAENLFYTALYLYSKGYISRNCMLEPDNNRKFDLFITKTILIREISLHELFTGFATGEITTNNERLREAIVTAAIADKVKNSTYNTMALQLIDQFRNMMNVQHAASLVMVGAVTLGTLYYIRTQGGPKLRL